MVLLALAAGCGGDGGGGDVPAGALPGVRDGAGWKTTFAYKTTGLLGTDGVRQVYPLAMNPYGAGVQLLYGEEAMGQQGMIGERKGFAFAGPTAKPSPFAAEVPYPGNQAADEISYFWSRFDEPVAYRIYQNVGQPARHVEFVKRGTTIFAADPHPDAYGRGTIGADDAFYTFGTLTYRAATAKDPWTNGGCYPVNGVPPVNQAGERVWEVEATDASRLLQLSTQGSVIKLWRNDPAAPRDPGVNLPTCGPVAVVDTGAPLERAFLRTVAGAPKVVAVTTSRILVYSWTNGALALEAQAAMDLALPILLFGGRKDIVDIATDGTDLWVAFADSAHDRRATVMVQRGSTFEVVGEAGFSARPVAGAPVLVGLESGGVLVAFGGRETLDNGDGYGSLWMARPE